MNPCIINFASGCRYPHGQERLAGSLHKHGYAGELNFRRKVPEGCPTHAAAPYAFKPAMFKEAQAAGHDVVLWLDAAIWTVKPIDSVLEHIRERGSYLLKDGWSVGQWCVDEALPTLGITRAESWEIPSLWATLIGMDLSQEAPRKFLDEWHRLSLDGVTFLGPRSLNIQPLDANRRVVYGHRHDQTAASVLTHRMNMPTVPVGESCITLDWGSTEDRIVFINRRL